MHCIQITVARKPSKFKLSKEQQKLAADNLNLARREAWRIQRTTGIEYQTLESVAFEGLCKAAFRYDASRPHPVTGKAMRFSSLAVPTIRGELLHWVRDKTYAMRLSHKMREHWIKGRKYLHAGASDVEIAAHLGILLDEWLEVRGVCSGPPLELKDQATPTEPLEPTEIDFAQDYLEAAEALVSSGAHAEAIRRVELYLQGIGLKIPRADVDAMLACSGCEPPTYDTAEDELAEGWVDLGNGRVQGALF